MEVNFSEVLSIISILIAVCGFFWNRYDTIHRISNSRLLDALDRIKRTADSLHIRSCRYWSAERLSESERVFQECDILVIIEELKQQIELLRSRNRRLQEKLHAIQIGPMINLDKLVTGGLFQDPTRQADPERCTKITNCIKDFKQAINKLSPK